MGFNFEHIIIYGNKLITNNDKKYMKIEKFLKIMEMLYY